MKNDQDGAKNFKPCHCYANPEDYSVCPKLQSLSIFAAFLVFYKVQRVYYFLVGIKTTGSERYWKQLLEKHKGNLDGYEVEDIGTHSIRKGATTYASSGSTTSPSSVAINNCGGWMADSFTIEWPSWQVLLIAVLWCSTQARPTSRYGRTVTYLQRISPNSDCNKDDTLTSISTCFALAS